MTSDATRRESRAWDKTPAGGVLGSEMVLLGQFETGEPGRGFGHGGAFANELLLVDVLSTEPTAQCPKVRRQIVRVAPSTHAGMLP